MRWRQIFRDGSFLIWLTAAFFALFCWPFLASRASAWLTMRVQVQFIFGVWGVFILILLLAWVFDGKGRDV